MTLKETGCWINSMKIEKYYLVIILKISKILNKYLALFLEFTFFYRFVENSIFLSLIITIG